MVISALQQESLAYRCRHYKANQGKLKGTEQYDPELVSALEEIKRKLKIAEEEREILRKATAYFAKVSQ